MSGKDLATALQQIINADFRPLPDPRQLVIDVIRREQRKARVLAFLSIVFWLLGVAGLLVFLFALDRFVVFIRIAPFDPSTGPQRLTNFDWQRLWGTNLLHHSMPYTAGAVVSLLLAAFCTVLLIFTSRRATLHQIHLALMELSEQLKELRPPPRPGTS